MLFFYGKDNDICNYGCQFLGNSLGDKAGK